MSSHRSTSLSTGINSREGINSNTWVLQYYAMHATTLKLRKNNVIKTEFPENEINKNKIKTSPFPQEEELY